MRMERTVMCLSFLQSRDEVLLVGTHSDLSNIDIAISHGDGAQILLAGSLTAVGELSHGTQLSGLGSLTAGVGVHLGIDNQNVHVSTGSQDMVQTAEADIVSPAVAAVHPDALLGQSILVGLQEGDIIRGLSSGVQSSHNSLGQSSGSCRRYRPQPAKPQERSSEQRRR